MAMPFKLSTAFIHLEGTPYPPSIATRPPSIYIVPSLSRSRAAGAPPLYINFFSATRLKNFFIKLYLLYHSMIQKTEREAPSSVNIYIYIYICPNVLFARDRPPDGLRVFFKKEKRCCNAVRSRRRPTRRVFDFRA
jgi:hypothetical protein